MDTDKVRKPISVSIFLILLLAACSGRAAPAFTPSVGGILLPSHTAIHTSETATTAISLPAMPTSTPFCENGMAFISDLTIPDGTVVNPGASLDKQWAIQNTGSCNWDERYRIRLVSGDALGAPVEQALYPARSGAQAVLRIVFTAPADPGEYVSEWQAFDFNGTTFGDTFFIKIIVQ